MMIVRIIGMVLVSFAVSSIVVAFFATEKEKEKIPSVAFGLTLVLSSISVGVYLLFFLK
jgi:hypothetical protein